ncbi:hypothetical protein VNO77_05090 [Canavalia gladiata]|uniref:Uncharacterized protein n=1 Tax=Canavalia gladiata TaxID=3824 RepID=A0AAN9MXQ2_CANGL
MLLLCLSVTVYKKKINKVVSICVPHTVVHAEDMIRCQSSFMDDGMTTLSTVLNDRAYEYRFHRYKALKC